MITPFQNGDVDYDSADLFTHYLVDSGVHGLVVGGTTGEGPALAAVEKARLLDTVATAASGRIPVFMGLEGANTAKMIAELSEIGDCPVDGYLLPAPSYVRPSQEGIYQHFMKIADAVRRPVMIYDIPARTGVPISTDTILRLVASGRFPAIKACGLSTEHLQALLAIPNLHVMCGDDSWISRALEMGAHGAVAASAQVAPQRFMDAYALHKRGSAGAASKRFNTLTPLIQSLFSEPNPGPVKAALALQGWCCDELRLPMMPATPACREGLQMTLGVMHALDHDARVYADKSSK